MRTAAIGGQPRSPLVNDLLTVWFRQMAEAHVVAGSYRRRPSPDRGIAQAEPRHQGAGAVSTVHAWGLAHELFDR